MHNDGDLDDTRALVGVVYVGKVCRLQERDQEDPESRAGRLARDRDHHAQVIKKVSKMMTLLMTMFIILKLKIVYVGKVCRLQARDQEEEEERIARLARKRDHQAQVI